MTTNAPPFDPLRPRSDILNIPEGIVALSYPAGFSEESLQDIEAWLDLEKSRLRRWVKEPASGIEAASGRQDATAE